jgi:dTDP-glucose 4,6-dehydratase
MSKILVTGCQGTLGRPLVNELRHRGHDVWGCDLSHGTDERVIRADIREFRQLERLIERTGPLDYVYHLAGEFGRINGEEYYETLWSTNAVGTRNVLELQRLHGFRLLFSSSSEIYGDSGDELLRESLPIERPIVQHNDYATSKWVNEVQIMNFEKRFSIEAMRLRFFNVYGPGEQYHRYRSVVCLFSYRALHNEPFTVYKGYQRDLTFIHDFTQTLANACEAFTPGEVYNIGGRESISIELLSEMILEQAGKSTDLVSYVSEDEHNVRSKRPDISKAMRDLGHDPQVKLEDGIRQTITWMRSEYDVPVDSLAQRS